MRIVYASDPIYCHAVVSPKGEILTETLSLEAPLSVEKFRDMWVGTDRCWWSWGTWLDNGYSNRVVFISEALTKHLTLLDALKAWWHQ